MTMCSASRLRWAVTDSLRLFVLLAMNMRDPHAVKALAARVKPTSIISRARLARTVVSAFLAVVVWDSMVPA